LLNFRAGGHDWAARRHRGAKIQVAVGDDDKKTDERIADLESACKVREDRRTDSAGGLHATGAREVRRMGNPNTV